MQRHVGSNAQDDGHGCLRNAGAARLFEEWLETLYLVARLKNEGKVDLRAQIG